MYKIVSILRFDLCVCVCGLFFYAVTWGCLKCPVVAIRYITLGQMSPVWKSLTVHKDSLWTAQQLKKTKSVELKTLQKSGTIDSLMDQVKWASQQCGLVESPQTRPHSESFVKAARVSESAESLSREQGRISTHIMLYSFQFIWPIWTVVIPPFSFFV